MTSDSRAQFEAFVQRHARFVFRVAYAVLLNAHDAEDAVQETFLKLFRNGGWQQAHNERAFLARTAWRVAVDLRPQVRRPASDAIDAADEADHISSPGPGPERLTLIADEHRRIHALIDALPEELRLPLVLSSFEEMNSRDVAAVLGIPEGTVRTRLQRARGVLREKLARLHSRGTEVRHG